MGRKTLSNLIYVVVFLLLAARISAATDIVPFHSSWKYRDDGSDQGTAWQSPSFDDSTWASGSAELGYGDGDEATVVSFGSNPNRKYTTTYFRKTFTVSNPSAFPYITLKLKRDDGGVVYLNGVEIFRSNMPSGSITYTTLASSSSNATNQGTVTVGLTAGDNLLAVEIHQNSLSSADLSFDLELSGTDQAAITRGPYLQLMRNDGVTVRWRTDFPTSSRVRYGLTSDGLSNTQSDSTLTTEHSITLNGLANHIQYYYLVGTTDADLITGSSYYFRTAPPIHHPIATRIWILGNSGTGDANAKAVRDGYLTFGAGKYTDQWIMLGNNAFTNGTDSEYQSKLFNVYGTFLKRSVLWPALGEADTAGSTNPPSSLPFYSIFDAPKNAEAGGVASGTEAYYSFTIGTIHFVCLDSQTSDRSGTGPMATWLNSDLAANEEPWLIAFFHHSPYSKGDHDSDIEPEMMEMRQNILPILENYEVDLVLTSHSDSYERSYFLDGHYGLSGDLTSSMIKNGGDGRVDGNGAYIKHQNTVHEGTVYTVVGSSGKTGGGSLNHPAMFVSMNDLGSLVLDIASNGIDAKFVTSTGAITDYFRLEKVNSPPAVTLTSPHNGDHFKAGSNITLSATVVDEDNRRVIFYNGNSRIDIDWSVPYGIVWTNVRAGTYTLRAVAEDIFEVQTSTAAISITVDR